MAAKCSDISRTYIPLDDDDDDEGEVLLIVIDASSTSRIDTRSLRSVENEMVSRGGTPDSRGPALSQRGRRADVFVRAARSIRIQDVIQPFPNETNTNSCSIPFLARKICALIRGPMTAEAVESGLSNEAQRMKCRSGYRANAICRHEVKCSSRGQSRRMVEF